MSHLPFSWHCPACNEPLLKHNNQWSCVNNHLFDCAKEGYVNLLLAQHKNSKTPGDNKEMVNARRGFLSRGHYSPLANHLGQSLSAHVPKIKNISTNSLNIFDAGCGEGYYLNSVVTQLTEQFSCVTAAGVDISKPAVAKAAKQNKDAHFAVASTYSLPLANQSQDAVIQVFAPSKDSEIHRVLKKEGLWIQVNPGANHLMDLKKQIYDTPKHHAVTSNVPSGFSLLEQKDVMFTLDLQNPDCRKNLLMMTPFYWTVSTDKKAVLLDSLLSVQAHFDVRVLQAV